MNKVFKIVWSKTKGCYVVASEFAKSHQSGATRASRKVMATLLLSSMVLMQHSVYASYITADKGFMDGKNSVGFDTGNVSSYRLLLRGINGITTTLTTYDTNAEDGVGTGKAMTGSNKQVLTIGLSTESQEKLDQAASSAASSASSAESSASSATAADSSATNASSSATAADSSASSASSSATAADSSASSAASSATAADSSASSAASSATAADSSASSAASSATAADSSASSAASSATAADRSASSAASSATAADSSASSAASSATAADSSASSAASSATAADSSASSAASSATAADSSASSALSSATAADSSASSASSSAIAADSSASNAESSATAADSSASSAASSATAADSSAQIAVDAASTATSAASTANSILDTLNQGGIAGGTINGEGALATGKNSQAIGDYTSAYGTNAAATADNATAIGANSQATAENSVALGANSVASEANTVSIGSVGNERRLTNVADGVNDTDAVNMRQLNAVSNKVGEVQNEVKNVGALSAALSGLKPIQYDPAEPTQIMAALGTYRGHNAMALGVAHYVNDSTMFNAGLAYGNDDSKVMANAGVTWKFGTSSQKEAATNQQLAGKEAQQRINQLTSANQAQATQIQNQQAELNAQNDRIAKLEALVQQLVQK